MWYPGKRTRQIMEYLGVKANVFGGDLHNVEYLSKFATREDLMTVCDIQAQRIGYLKDKLDLLAKHLGVAFDYVPKRSNTTPEHFELKKISKKNSSSRSSK